MEDAFKYDCFFNNTYVVTGACALARSGLILLSGRYLELQTSIKELSIFRTSIYTYYYNPEIDYEYELQPSSSNPHLLQPSKERALVECIKHLDWIDEGLLIEGLKTYIEQFYNKDKLNKVAKYFNLDSVTLDYWIEEAKNDYEV